MFYKENEYLVFVLTERRPIKPSNLVRRDLIADDKGSLDSAVVAETHLYTSQINKQVVSRKSFEFISTI